MGYKLHKEVRIWEKRNFREIVLAFFYIYVTIYDREIM